MNTKTEKQYSVWSDQEVAISEGPEFFTWERAEEDRAFQMLSAPEREWRIWDHSTTPPTDVTDGPPAPTVPMIPAKVKELTVTRSDSLAGDVRVIASGPGWTVNFWTTEADWLADLADMVQRLTATQEKRT